MLLQAYYGQTPGAADLPAMGQLPHEQKGAQMIEWFFSYSYAISPALVVSLVCVSFGTGLGIAGWRYSKR
jgi:hypothetical protein